MIFYPLGVVLVLGLFAYRLARLLAHDKVGEPVRKWAYRSQTWWRGGPWLNYLVTCPFCLSVYFAAGGVLFYGWLITPDWPGWEILLAIPAVAGVAALASAADLALTIYVEKHPA